MTDEEKKAVANIKLIAIGNFITWFTADGCIEMEMAAKTVLNLIEKQEKVIDEMANKLSEYTCWNKDNLNMYKLVPIEEIKQYFYRKVENGG